MNDHPQTIAVAITGASGSVYGMRLLECLLQKGHRVYLMLSSAGEVVLPLETGIQLPAELREAQHMLQELLHAQEGQLRLFGQDEWSAPVASGSNPPDAMVVAPCTVGTLSAIANGASNSLIERAADVMLKEQRKLILMIRETPLSAIHLENMLKLARLGVVTMPASPGFYNRPQRVEDLVDYMVARVLDQLGIEHDLMGRWGDD